ncbi:LOW QUALITY PROTEIN: hypothetical protein KIPB_000914 [Kipferlia bialata]|uniref:Uncharacterized protein n=1 Tax=Kipferlia bialata TaxID=797122 RepID=A0A9K3CP87_9EUKA|nr:LOW QUALITY PROTEIN: hypothetical protein KIPB_000914 [Kipferlia bialata]
MDNGVPLFLANRIIDGIFVGSYMAAEDEDFIFSNSITHVVNCCAQEFPNRFASVGVRYLSFKWADDPATEVFDPAGRNMDACVRFITEAVDSDQCILVHSMDGSSRSVIVLAAFLVHRFHWPPARALQYIATKRFNADPLPSFRRQLNNWAQTVRRERGAFKDIFGDISGMVLSSQEELHRNSFLNVVEMLPQPETMAPEPDSRSEVRRRLTGAHATVPEGAGRVRWRDGAKRNQVPFAQAVFRDPRRQKLPNRSSMLFRPASPAYFAAHPVRCVPVVVDPDLSPCVSLEMDLALHERNTWLRPDPKGKGQDEAGALVILATHSSYVTPFADTVLTLEDGKVVDHASQTPEAVQEEEEEEDGAVGVEDVDMDTPDVEAEGERETDGKIMVEESRRRGKVPWAVWAQYGRALGTPFGLVLMALLFVMAQVLNTGATFWLSYWVGDGSDEHSSGYLVAMYAAISFAGVVTVFSRETVFRISCQRASAAFHTSLLSTLLRAPLTWFQTRPLGRVLNRFSADMLSLDEKLPPEVSMVVRFSLMVGAIFFAICVVSPYYIAVVVPSLIVYVHYLNVFRSSHRELFRLESIARSPVLSIATETLGGLSTLRAYDYIPVLTDRFYEGLDKNGQMNYVSVSNNRWISVRLETLASVIACTSALLVAVVPGIPTNMAALALSTGLSTSQSLGWLIRRISIAEAELSSVERVLEYTNDPDQEPEWNLPSDDPMWPQTGKVSFRSVSARYRPELPLVLQDLSFEAEAGQRVALVGRTGSGKSTTANIMFRLLDIESGTVELDGVDITSVGLHHLRRAITIVAQNPTLFTDTLRNNLDPSHLYSDTQLVQALRQVNLLDWAQDRVGMVREGEGEREGADVAETATPLGPGEPMEGEGEGETSGVAPVPETSDPLSAVLDIEIASGGSNLSAGQRQLVCLARAMLRDSKVIVLDEATANVDRDNDERIQSVLNTMFSELGCTIITIAHRLETIIDFDKVIVLDAGMAVEQGVPRELAEQEGGVFGEMWRERQLSIVQNKEN